MNDFFRKFSQRASEVVGSPGAFIIAILLLMIWAVTGSIFHFSDTWKMVINTTPTVITFLMVFLIQNMQNHDARALHLKLDELIRSIEGARNTMVNLEELSDDELEKIQNQFKRIRQPNAEKFDHLDEAGKVAKINEGQENEKQ